MATNIRPPSWIYDNLPFDSLYSTYSQKMSHIVRKQLPAVGATLLPSPIYNHLNSRKETTRPVGKTAYLDGFRGYAALGVLILHMTMNIFPNSNYAYNGQKGRDWIFQLPFFRLLYTGQPALFFIISGYVLSLGTLKKARAQSYGPVQLDIGSKIFRRGLRLYIPSVISTMIPMLLNYYNLFAEPSPTKDMPQIFHNLPEPQPTLTTQIWEWIKMTAPLFWPFSFDNYSQNTPYAYQLWTIPVEFRCSMVLFLVNSALCRCTIPARMAINATLALTFLAFSKWDIFLFLAGSFIAELDIIKQDHVSQEPPLLDLSEKQAVEHKTPKRISFIAHIVVLILSLWMLSVPGADIWNAWTFSILETYAPPTYTVIFQFWDAVGTFGLLWAFTGLPQVQSFFSKPLFLYLGKISFSLYLIHTITLKAVLYPMLPWLWSHIGYQSIIPYTLTYLIGAIITIVSSLWLADLFHRFVEQPSADFTNWLDRVCCAPKLQMPKKP